MTSTTSQLTKTDLKKLNVLQLYEHFGALERSLPLLSSESQPVAQAELEQCLALRSEKIDRIYYAWAHHEDMMERIKKEQELLQTARKHHESQVNSLKGLVSWLRRSAPSEDNKITGNNYQFVLSKKTNLTVELTTPVEEWDEVDVNNYCVIQTTTTTKEVVVTSMGGDIIEQVVKPTVKTEIIPNVDKLCNDYKKGKRIPKGVKIIQDYTIKRKRIFGSKGVDNFSSEYPAELLPESCAAD